MKDAYRSGAALLPIILAIWPLQSLAAEAPAKSASATGLEEVVVVARRTEERLQDVPISIAAVSDTQIRNASITRSSDLIKVVPSLSIGEQTTGPTNSFSIRGIRTGVVTYFADVPTSSGGVNDQLWDLSSVQALAGPQGTLFGRNSTGGALLFVPQRPNDRFGGFVEGGYGNFNAQRVTAVANLPIQDGLAVRLGAQIVRRDGVIDNQLGPALQSQHRNAFRASVLFEPGDGRFTDYLVADYSERDEVPNAFITKGANSLTIGCFTGIGCSYGPAPSRFGGPTIASLQAKQDQLGIRSVASSFKDVLRSKSYGVSNTAKYDVVSNRLTAKYIFGYRHDEQYSVANQTHLDLPIEIIQNSNEGTPTYSHEFQLLGNALDGHLNVVAGAFFLKTAIRPRCMATPTFRSRSTGISTTRASPT